LACGYGRFTIPLASQGYNIRGIDISPNLIKEAKLRAKKNNLTIDFKLGDMRKLPYKDKSFDAIICMWSAFSELTKELDQVKSLKEMLRVLNEGGIALLEIPKPQKKRGVVIVSTIDKELTISMCMHNKTTMTELIKKIRPNKYKIEVVDFGGRDRMIVRFWK
jgi:ubiquinone/menaquinone biosynthesis C-methylase UbiE